MTSRGRVLLADSAPGTELFRSDRMFHLVAHTISHGTTLLRSWENADGTFAATRVDLAFQSTYFVKLRRDYRGLTIRVPRSEELDAIDREIGGIDGRRRGWPLVVHSEGVTDFVATMVFAWAEDNGDFWGPGMFAGIADLDGPPWEHPPLPGIDGGIYATASSESLISALTTTEADTGASAGDRQQYRHIWVLMRRSRGIGFEGAKSHSVGAFLTFEEAEGEMRRRTAVSRHDEWWIDTAPIAV